MVGAGLVGLAAARRLGELRPDERVAVIDAQRVGFGASSRNAGFVVDLTDFAARMSPADCQRYIRVARFGMSCLADLIHQNRIACDWDDSGILRAAAGPQGIQILSQWPALLDGIGSRHRWLDAEATAAHTGSRFYQAAVHLPGMTVNPVALMRGLASSLPANVSVFEGSPVRKIDRAIKSRERSGFRVAAGNGAIVCDRLFLATNGYTPGLGFLVRQDSPLWSFGSLTRVLTPEEQQRLGGERHWGVLPMDPSGSTVRRTPDQRILIRNTFHYSSALGVREEVRAAAVARHRRAFLARFPALQDVPFTHSWSGLMGMSSNGQPFFGELEPGLYSVAVFNAAGLALGTAAGRLLADLAMGVESAQLSDLRQLPPPSRLPPEPLRTLSGLLRVAKQNRRAGAYL
ncbi:MAG TPA: FAD-binding oxidoreductase [Thermoanaerobaculia bacterium]|nr:FAD-binding oxidoreductase [Thermoanaerobaculia bacterium]